MNAPTVRSGSTSLGPLTAGAAIRSARSALAALHTSIGAAGLAAATTRPALLAQVDQHAAAIRESLLADVRPLNTVLLSRYAEGVRDAAVESGWRAPAGSTDWSDPDWSDPDWVLTRLLAVCFLADRRA